MTGSLPPPFPLPRTCPPALFLGHDVASRHQSQAPALPSLPDSGSSELVWCVCVLCPGRDCQGRARPIQGNGKDGTGGASEARDWADSASSTVLLEQFCFMIRLQKNHTWIVESYYHCIISWLLGKIGNFGINTITLRNCTQAYLETFIKNMHLRKTMDGILFFFFLP